MARFRRGARRAYYFAQGALRYKKTYRKGGFGASLNIANLAGIAVGFTGIGMNMIPPIAVTAVEAYSVAPVTIKGLGPVKGFGRGLIFGQLLRQLTGGINLGGNTGGSDVI